MLAATFGKAFKVRELGVVFPELLDSKAQRRRLIRSRVEPQNPVEKMDSVGPKLTKIGWIGTGVMGNSMCGHLINAGYGVTVFNRTKSKTEFLHSQGATVVDSPSEVAQNSDIVFSIVGYPHDVREIILGKNGVLNGFKKGGIIVDMTTSEPSLAKEIYEKAKHEGCESLDAPVSGGDKGAREARLSIMVGGDASVFQHVSPLLHLLGNPKFLGPPGSGQSCKLANQVTIASTMVGLVEGLLYAHKAGLDVEEYLNAISGGAAGSKSLDLYAPRILKRDFQPGFFVHHFVKDLGIALEECQRMNLSLPGLALAQQLYVSLKAHGNGDLGTQSLLLALERLNNTTLLHNEKKQ